MGIFTYYYMTSTRFQNAPRSAGGGSWGSASDAVTLRGWFNANTASYDGIAAVGAHIASVQLSGSSIWIENDSWDTDIGTFAQDSWYFFSLSLSGSTATLRYSADQETIADTLSVSIGTWSATTISVGTNAAGDNAADVQLHHWRALSGVTETDETFLAAISDSAADGEWAYWQLEDAALTDSSGNSRPLTGSGGTISVGSSSAPIPTKTEEYNAIMMGSCF